MGSTRRRFTEEYEAQAVSLVIDSDRTNVEVAGNIGVHEMTPGRWVKQAKDSGAADVANTPLTIDERAELDRLRAENAELRMQAEFSKMWRPGSRETSSEICCDRGLG